MIELRLEGLVHVYPEGLVRALDGVDLAFGPGERVALVGQNGGGKSTLVHHLNGLLRPTAGHVIVDGADARDRTVARLARLVGLVLQDPDRQIFAGSVGAEASFGPRNLGLAGGELRATVGSALTEVGLESEWATNPYDLGYSRRKLLAVASILAMRTPVVVLDEPTTGQDARGVAIVEGIVARLASAGRTVIAISHDMRFVAESFERVVVMQAGRVILDGPPNAVFDESHWPELAVGHVEPPLAARAGARLGLGSTPTDAGLIQALWDHRSG